MGNSDSKRLAMRAWLKQKGAHYGGLLLAALLGTLLAAPAKASKWPPALSHPSLDAASALVLRQGAGCAADERCSSVELVLLCAIGEASPQEWVGAQRKLSLRGDDQLALPQPNGQFAVDDSPLLELSNNGLAGSIFSRVAPLGVEASRLADGGCDLGGGRSGLDSVLSSLIVLALAALGMRFRT